MFWMFMTALWVVMLLAPLALLIALLPSGRDCPRCGTETLPIRSAVLRPVRKFMGRRWCTACGWEGTARVTRHPHPVPVLERVAEEHEEVDDDAVWRGERNKEGGLL
jgi:transcription elongation factor Elf1